MESEIKSAVNKAIDECIEEGILKEFFQTRREEIEEVLELKFTFEKQLHLARKKGKEKAIISLVKDGTITSIIAAQKLGVSEEEVIRLTK